MRSLQPRLVFPDVARIQTVQDRAGKPLLQGLVSNNRPHLSSTSPNPEGKCFPCEEVFSAAIRF